MPIFTPAFLLFGLVLVLFNIIIGAWSVSFIGCFFGLSIPFIACAAIGLFFAEITVPVAIILAIVGACLH